MHRPPSPADELLIATPDMADPRLDVALQDLLRLIRHELKMDVAFLAEFVAGRRVFRKVDAGPGRGENLPRAGDSNPLEESLCQQVVDGRVPRWMDNVPALRAQFTLPEVTRPMGAHAGVPVLRKDGSLYGTLCCFSFAPVMDLDDVKLKRLEMSALMAARLLDEAAGDGAMHPN